ncbi:MAG: AtpZ/AtpI family protein [Haliscomenobacter sp.]|nr:AtpZ/AtpI family protein [Haliscomenobacter sp.]
MPKPEPDKRGSDRMRDLAKYSGLAFQIGFIILAGAMLGKWLDGRFQFSKPVFTLCLSLLSVFAALYFSLKDFIGKKPPS